MEKFQIVQPSEWLRPYVKQYWFLTIDHVARSSQRYIPSGCAMLVFHRGDRIYSTRHRETQPRSSLCGQSVLYTDAVYSGRLDFVAVVFQPVAARTVFGIPMNGLRNKNMDVNLLGDTSLLELEKRLAETADNNRCAYWIERYLIKKLRNFASDRFDRMNTAIRSIDYGQQNIAELARTACLGYKQFKRVFAEYTGLKPEKVPANSPLSQGTA